MFWKPVRSLGIIRHMIGIRLLSLLYIAVLLAPLPLSFFWKAFTFRALDADSLPFVLLYAAQLAYGLLLARKVLFRGREGEVSDPAPLRRNFIPTVLFSYSLLIFLFTYIFATNANLDYVQWFIKSGGNLHLAIDTATERAVAFARYLPFLLLNFILIGKTGGTDGREAFPSVLSLFLVLFSALLTALSFPSFLSSRGYGSLAWISLVPVFLVLRREPPGRGIFYGVLYGTISSVLVNYWLGTFSLVSLQLIILIQLGWYLIFMVFLVPLLQVAAEEYRFLLTACLWTFFELCRSSGFLGYPWGLFGASQYAFPAVLQTASVTGVWGLSFLIVLFNAALADFLAADAEGGRRRGALFFSLSCTAAALLFGIGTLSLHPLDAGEDGSTKAATIVLVQQNTDPRKDDYEKTLSVLKKLTNESLGEKPDLIVWSETAFVPNIRRWREEDPAENSFAALVQDFLSYQAGLGTPLLTGNDDYTLPGSGGAGEERLDYNAALLFSESGDLLDTYHKIKLVPFTEYFPYREALPWVYKTLLAFDVHFWEPGTKRTVFRLPKFSFSTPICFEDVFPDSVRRFVLEGADLIVNISNDYWSLTEAEARQHAVHSLLRAVENRRPLLRAAASGQTLQADEYGRVIGSLPVYEEGYLRARVPLARPGEKGGLTVYTRWGDWFPLLCGFIVLAVSLLSLLRRTAGRQS